MQDTEYLVPLGGNKYFGHFIAQVLLRLEAIETMCGDTNYHLAIDNRVNLNFLRLAAALGYKLKNFSLLDRSCLIESKKSLWYSSPIYSLAIALIRH